MLPAKHRARRKLLEKFFSSEGKRNTQTRVFSSPFSTLRISLLDSAEIKVTFIVSAKVAPLAVSRNLLKRRARAIMAKRLQVLEPGLLLIFLFKKGAPDLSYPALEEDMLELLVKAHCLQ